jgi:hypothetical protein
MAEETLSIKAQLDSGMREGLPRKTLIIFPS